MKRDVSGEIYRLDGIGVGGGVTTRARVRILLLENGGVLLVLKRSVELSDQGKNVSIRSALALGCLYRLERGDEVGLCGSYGSLSRHVFCVH